MSEKIEITREQFRDFCKDLERELFGPKKPREMTLYRDNGGSAWRQINMWDVGGEVIRVREVLDDGE